MIRQRIINSQMNISLPSEMHEELRESAWQERKTLSALCREILELGLKKRKEDEETANTMRAAGSAAR